MEQLFAIQQNLDERILKKHGLQRKDITNDKVLALLTEIAELANETRCFKFWSEKPASGRNVILEEYVDGIHFILSLGIDGGWKVIPDSIDQKDCDLTEQFLTVYKTILSFRSQPERETFIHMFREYLYLGSQLGFTVKDIESAYYEKNETNHKRQTEGY